MKAADKFQNPTTAVNQLWQTDLTYLKIIGWGWYYLSTVMDDYSRYIIAWRLCTTMSAADVSATLQDALEATGLERGSVRQRPKLLTDNGPCYASSELRAWLEDRTVLHTRGKPYHPHTQGTIERWHRTLKDRILLEHYYLPGELERQIEDFVTDYNTRRYCCAPVKGRQVLSARRDPWTLQRNLSRLVERGGDGGVPSRSWSCCRSGRRGSHSRRSAGNTR